MMTLTLTGCVREVDARKAVHDGTAADAVIRNVSASLNAITVKDADATEGIFGENCALDCSDASVVYCDNETGEVWEISLADLAEGDEVIIQISASETENVKNGMAKIEYIQLSTQRLTKRDH